MIIFFLFLVGIHATESKINYDACKKEEFKPQVCERYKSLIPPSKR
jgi:hypothetical protein